MECILLLDRDPVAHVGKQVHVGQEVFGGNKNSSFSKIADVSLGLLNLGREQFLVDGAVVDLLQSDPLAGEYAVELDDPAEQIGVGLLPERLLALAE